MHTVIMAGGKGTRFWPRSRSRRPKQLLSITGGRTMIQRTVDRITPLVHWSDIWIVAGQVHVPGIRRQLPDLPEGNILVEPAGRNTAPCIGLAAVYIQRKDPESTMAVLSSDHMVGEEQRFRDVLLVADRVARREDALLTIGIQPSSPETGYGYIHIGKQVYDVEEQTVYQVQDFTEKPDLKTAEAFLKSGVYLWNSGMFVWRVDVILEEIRRLLPDLHAGLMEIAQAIGTDDERMTIEQVYGRVEGISIDYGVMEKARRVLALKGTFPWSDIGSWATLEEIAEKDPDGNAVIGRLVGIDTSGTIIYCPDKLVAAVGVKDLIVVETEDALLLCSKDRAQEVREIVEELERRGLEEYL